MSFTLLVLALIHTIQDTVSDIFEKYHSMMKSLAFSILRDYQLSENAVQEALIRLSANLKKIDNIDSKASRNYIYTVTKNEALRIYEDNKKYYENIVQFSEESGFNYIEGAIDIDAFCNKYGFSLEVSEALSGLSETDKDIIIYKYGAGYSLREIASLIDIDRGTVYKRHRRALDKIRKAMEASDEK